MKAMALGLAVACAAVSGCGRYGTHPSAPRAADQESVGDAVSTSPITNTTAKAAQAPTTTRRAAARVQQPRDFCAGPNRPGPVNVETRDDPAGVRLTLTVADALCFAPDDTVRIQLEVKNISDRTVEFDTSQPTHFTISPLSGGPAWHDHNCGRPDPDPPHTGPYELERGATVKYVADYPGPKASQAACGGQRGEQVVTGFVTLCTAGAADHDDCAAGRTRDVTSAAIHIRIGP